MLPTITAYNPFNTFVAGIPAASTPLSGGELVVVVQDGTSKRTPTANLFGGAGPIVAATNDLTFAVPSQYATVQDAVTAAASFDYRNRYRPTITIADGTYTNTVVYLLPLINCPIGIGLPGGVDYPRITGNITTPSNVKLADDGSHYTFISTPGSTWYLQGFQFTGTFGGFNVLTGGTITIDHIDWGGTFVEEGLYVNPHACAFFVGAALTISASTMRTWVYSRGIVVPNSSSLAIINPITFTEFFIGLDSSSSFFAAADWTVTGGGNVTTISACLQINNGAFFEADTNTKIDGVVLSRLNIPGAANPIVIDGCSYFQPDHYGTVLLLDNAGNLHANYNITSLGNWTFNSSLILESSSPVQLVFARTSDLTDVPWFGLSPDTYLNSGILGMGGFIGGHAAIAFDVFSGSIVSLANAVHGWGAETTDVLAGPPDTGFSRIAAAVVALGNGNVLDASGFLVCKNVYTNESSAILHNNGTLTGGSTGNTPTLTAGPVNGNPTKWLPYDDNGVTRYIPSW